MTGIYKITNKINQKCYIGQSRDIEHRWKEHIRVAKTNVASGTKDYPIYRAMQKYGIENFSFEILEECSVEELDKKEQYWIQYYDSYDNGYNLTLGGGGWHRYDYQDLVDQYYKYGTIQETAKQCGCHYHTVSNALKALDIKPNAPSPGHPRPIKQIDPYTLKVVNVYDSISDAIKALGLTSEGKAISAVLAGQKQVAYGYIWKDADFDETTLTPLSHIKNMHTNQKLLQIDLRTNEIVNIYNSVKEASAALNKSTKSGSKIYDVTSGKAKSWQGYGWKFVDPKDIEGIEKFA